MTAPLFGKLPAEYKFAYEQFFAMTKAEALPSSVRRNLSTLVDLANKIEYTLEHANPIWDTWDNQWGNRGLANQARQWHLDNLSLVKERLAKAIQSKREYYENTILGKITKFVLKLFCLWNRGNTAAIRKAEDFLMRYDSRYPVEKSDEGHKPAQFFWAPLVSAEWVRGHLNLVNFYNYDTPHGVEVLGGNNQVMPRFMVARI